MNCELYKYTLTFDDKIKINEICELADEKVEFIKENINLCDRSSLIKSVKVIFEKVDKNDYIGVVRDSIYNYISFNMLREANQMEPPKLE